MPITLLRSMLSAKVALPSLQAARMTVLTICVSSFLQHFSSCMRIHASSVVCAAWFYQYGAGDHAMQAAGRLSMPASWPLVVCNGLLSNSCGSVLVTHWPSPLRPQLQTLPVSAMASVWLCPQATETILRSGLVLR